MSIEVPETPEDVISAIAAGWPKSVLATSKVWHVQYMKQLTPFAGDPLKKGFQRAMENLEKGMPPKPDRIAAICRDMKRESQPVPRQNTWTPPVSKKLSPEGMADINRQMDEHQLAINNGTAGPLVPTLLRVCQGILNAHQKAVSDGRSV